MYPSSYGEISSIHETIEGFERVPTAHRPNRPLDLPGPTHQRRTGPVSTCTKRSPG